jgi:hypothetical protein
VRERERERERGRERERKRERERERERERKATFVTPGRRIVSYPSDLSNVADEPKATPNSIRGVTIFLLFPLLKKHSQTFCQHCGRKLAVAVVKITRQAGIRQLRN